MPEHVGADGLLDGRSVGNSFDNAFDLALAQTKLIIDGVVSFDEGSDAGGHRKNPDLALFAIWSAFAVDD